MKQNTVKLSSFGEITQKKAFVHIFKAVHRAILTYQNKPIANNSERNYCTWEHTTFTFNENQLGYALSSKQFDSLLETNPDENLHFRSHTLAQHLLGTYEILQNWEVPQTIANAGLFHSCYSTQQYPIGLYAYAQRHDVARLIGESSEVLVFIFCTHDRVALYEYVISLAKCDQPLPVSGVKLRNAFTGETKVFERQLVEALLVMHLADVMDQTSYCSFDFLYSILKVITRPTEKLQNLFILLAHSYYQKHEITLALDASKGSFTLANLTKHTTDFYKAKKTVASILDKNKLPSHQTLIEVDKLSKKLPFIVDLQWIRLSYSPELSDEERVGLQQQISDVYDLLGSTWSKKYFDRNFIFHRLATHENIFLNPSI